MHVRLICEVFSLICSSLTPGMYGLSVGLFILMIACMSGFRGSGSCDSTAIAGRARLAWKQVKVRAPKRGLAVCAIKFFASRLSILCIFKMLVWRPIVEQFLF